LFTKIVKIAAIRSIFIAKISATCICGWDSTLDLTGGAYDASRTPQSAGESDTPSPFPTTSTLAVSRFML